MVGVHIDRVYFRMPDFSDTNMIRLDDFSMSFFHTYSFKDANLEGIQVYRCSEPYLMDHLWSEQIWVMADMKRPDSRTQSSKKWISEGSDFKNGKYARARLTHAIVGKRTDFTGVIFDGMIINLN